MSPYESAGPALLALTQFRQGDAIVLRSGSEFGLIDTGADPDALMACLRRLGIRHLALLVLTHYDADHVGAAPAVSAMVGTALVGLPDEGDASAARLLGDLREHHADIHVATRGDSGSLGALRWRVIWPDRAQSGTTTSNEASIALEIAGKGVRMAFLGDLDRKAQDALIADGDARRADVVKVAHHGSADQSGRLYGLIRPQLALISSGEGNGYGHPRGTALDLLRSAGAQLARTDLEGTVLVALREGQLAVWAERSASVEALWTPAQR
ncbi:ComEC/Rec2 family competence protein [Gryllotalpicola reticulitermitis]|uniref:ComEC/Rec2 family competence protein n=1 Tax=Gryllotalpicola reticulitermitis TaxID=1184153 RepID=A0ABV8QAM0_9MICO